MTDMTRRASLALGLGSAMAAGATHAAPAARTTDITAALTPFACNLDTWFREIPFADRFAKAASLGFRKVEFWAARREADGADAAKIRALLDANGLTLTQYAPTPPDFADPAKHDDLVAMIGEAIKDCGVMGCRQITLTGHGLIPGMSREDMLAGYMAGLMRIAPVLEAAQVMALVEPFNTVNHPNHLLNGSRPAVAMIRAVKSPMVRLQWDFYHMQLEDGDLIEKFTAAADCVGYIQQGDVPGRHQPGTGEVNYVNLLKAVHAAGYNGAMGLEYMPADADNARAVADAAALSKAAGLV